MEPTIKCGKHLAECADISNSMFHDVNLSGADFDDVNLSGARFHNINLSDIRVEAAQIGGASFRHVGLPPGSPGSQRPLRFTECDLNGTTIEQCNLSGVTISNCEIAGMTINGVAVTDLFDAYNQNKR